MSNQSSNNDIHQSTNYSPNYTPVDRKPDLCEFYTYSYNIPSYASSGTKSASTVYIPPASSASSVSANPNNTQKK